MQQGQSFKEYWPESGHRPKPRPTIIFACAEVHPAIRGVYIRTTMIRSRYTSDINTCRRRRHCYLRHHRHCKTREGVNYGCWGIGASGAGRSAREGGDWKLCMVWVSITIAVLNQTYLFITSCQDCPGQPGYPRQARLPRITGIFHRKHSKMGSVDPNEWVQCDNCGWWMPTESNDYVDYVFLGPYSSSLHRNRKWCESGNTLDRRTREHFRDCCGEEGFGPDDWFRVQ